MTQQSHSWANIQRKTWFKKVCAGFHGGAMVESPPADAGDTGSCPSPRRSHMPQSSWAHGPGPLGLHVRSLCCTMGEAAAVRGPRTAKTNKQKRVGCKESFIMSELRNLAYP